MKLWLRGLTVFLVLSAIELSAQEISTSMDIATLRQGIDLETININLPKLGNASNQDIKRSRTYPMQPPIIPHKIDAYQVDLRVNKCLSCHSRSRTEQSQAPMVSVTHFMDRDGNFLADVSPRRYFCRQCHVTQVERKDLIKNNFKDVQQLLTQKPGYKENK